MRFWGLFISLFRFPRRARAILLSACALLPACRPPATEAPRDNSQVVAPPPSKESSLGQLAPDEPSSAIAVETDDPRLGSSQARITIVAFLDYQCSFCAAGFNTLLQLRSAYSDEDLRVVFKHQPLQSHELAIPAAIAGQAVMDAAGSEAFFQFSEVAFKNQAQLGYMKLAEWAEEAGVSRELYNERVAAEVTVHRVAQDARLGHRIGVDATPAFFVNGRLVSGAQPIEYFRQVIGEELEKMDRAEGSSWKANYQAIVAENMRGSLLESLLERDPDDYLVPVDGSATLGPEDAPVTMVMFTDFECPFCKSAEVTVKLLKDKYKEKLRIVFKHLPLPFHQKARPAALLAESVHAHRGDVAFFSAADELFRRSPELGSDALKEVGLAHGLTQRQIDAALEDSDPGASARLRRDSDLSDDVLARGTPHFFINGKRLSGAQPVEQFEALVDLGLRRAEELEKNGVPATGIYAKLQEGALSPGIPVRLQETIGETGLPSRGSPDAPVTVHIFSDFECPYCREGEMILDELDQKFPGKLRYVWHDFPLDFHERARPAARAAREAFAQKGAQGFWKMHALLFGLENEATALGDEEILEHGKSLGLDPNKLKASLHAGKHDVAIDLEVARGAAVGIRGTPAYVIGGYVVTGLKPLRYLERIVERSIQDQVAPPPAAKGAQTAK